MCRTLAHVLTECSPPQAADEVLVDRVGASAVVTLNRGAAYNALRFATWGQLSDLFDGFRADRALRVVVLRGAGERAFSAGADIKEFPERRMPADRALVYNRTLSTALNAVMSCPVPVLAMIRGLAVGGGCELAAACDLRIACEDARLGIPIGRLGVTLGEVEARAVGRLIGSARLKDLLFTGRLLDAYEALRIGLVDRVASPDRVVEVTLEIAEAIASASSTTIRAAKLVADFEGLPAAAEQAAELAALAAAAYDGDDLKEGVDAFLTNRAPCFTT